MTTSIPPPSVEQRDPLVVALAGDSIELKALASGLSHEGATVQWLTPQSPLESRSTTPRLVVCDLACEGSLDSTSSALGHFGSLDKRPELITLGSPQRPLSIALARTVHGAAQRYPRPLNILEVTQQIVRFGNRARPSGSQQSGLPAMLAGHRSSSLPPPIGSASQQAFPNSRLPQPSRSAALDVPRAEPVNASSGAQEPTAISPELEFLLADAQNKLHAWVSQRPLHSDPAPTIDPEDRHLAENVWQALSEPLDEQDVQDHWQMPSTGAAIASEAPPGQPPPAGNRGPRTPGDSAKNATGQPRASDAPEEDTSSQVAARGETIAHPLLADREVERGEPLAGGNTVADVSASLAASAPPSEASSMPTLSPRSNGSMAPGTIAQLQSVAPTLSPPQALRPISIAPATTRAEPRVSIAPAGPDAASERAQAITQPPPSKPPTRRTAESPQRSAEAQQLPKKASTQAAWSPADAPAQPVQNRSEDEADEATPTRAPRPKASPGPFGDGSYSLPSVLTAGAAREVLAQAVRQRFTGCLSFEVDQGLRRAVLRDGDFVVAASAVHGESLVSFLVKRGDLSSEAAQSMGHRIPMQGRYAGAALVAHGLIGQGELWAVLRAHAEAVLTQIVQIERGHVEAEAAVPERLAAEPAVFGGATGAEVFVEIVRRSVPSDWAKRYLQEQGDQLLLGSDGNLLSECALGPSGTHWVDRAQREPLTQLLGSSHDEPSLPCVLYALLLMKVLEVPPRSHQPSLPPSKLSEQAECELVDDGALRAKIHARRVLVDNGDYFSVLGVGKQATGYEIRRSYLDLTRQFSPETILRPGTVDLSEAVDEILEVLHEAYDVLRDTRRRERYRAAIVARPS